MGWSCLIRTPLRDGAEDCGWDGSGGASTRGEARPAVKPYGENFDYGWGPACLCVPLSTG